MDQEIFAYHVQNILRKEILWSLALQSIRESLGRMNQDNKTLQKQGKDKDENSICSRK